MKDFNITRESFSRFFWETIGPGYAHITQEQELEALREKADYKTGSISHRDAADLCAIINYFQPASIAEVGTFIGRSTFAMADAMKAGEIWTCDVSNDLTLPKHKRIPIRQFQRMNSTAMFRSAILNKRYFDAFYIDGRLSDEDLNLMAECEDVAGSIIILDDFEGVEKGVANAMKLMGRPDAGGGARTLIYPRSVSHKTAVILPFRIIEFVAQA